MSNRKNEFKIVLMDGVATLEEPGAMYPYLGEFADAAGYPQAATCVLSNVEGVSKRRKVRSAKGEKVDLLAVGEYEGSVMYVARTQCGEIFVIHGSGINDIDFEVIGRPGEISREGLDTERSDEQEVDMPLSTYLNVLSDVDRELQNAIREAYVRGYEDGRKAENNR